MSVLIKGVAMPKDGEHPLWIALHSDGMVEYNANKGYGWQMTTAVPVPPHGDLIGREWLIDIALHLMNTAKNDDIYNGVKWLWQYVIEAPTIIPAEP